MPIECHGETVTLLPKAPSLCRQAQRKQPKLVTWLPTQAFVDQSPCPVGLSNHSSQAGCHVRRAQKDDAQAREVNLSQLQPDFTSSSQLPSPDATNACWHIAWLGLHASANAEDPGRKSYWFGTLCYYASDQVRSVTARMLVIELPHFTPRRSRFEACEPSL